ncbi:hypothetical protein Cgig2_024191 [Carnegiea gigantea]|uniref:Uncharacterized protein n=1 Tax=Carnegiea gigantea TaxID=171969 RepID=A0A9Q1QIU3_9CARY|nr:hypothetical protein Cgig2_024191 [Carnegiea gigantea]
MVAALEKNKAPFDFDPYSNVNAFLKKWDYFPGMAIERRAQRWTTFPLTQKEDYKLSLGYHPTSKEIVKDMMLFDQGYRKKEDPVIVLSLDMSNSRFDPTNFIVEILLRDMWRVWDRWHCNDGKAKPTVLLGLDTSIFILANFGQMIVHYWDALSITALPH